MNIGHGNVVVAEQIVIDATNGRRTRAVIVTESDHLILSSLEPATLAQRLATDRGPAE